MTLHRLGLFALAFVAGVVTTTVQAAERDVVGWEGARWGMNEREIRDAFCSKLLVSLAGDQPGETVLSIPGYVFLGCPFDVTFRFSGGHGLVRINLTEVGNLLGHHGNGIAGYGAACKLIDRRLEDMFGPGQARGSEKSWAFPSGMSRLVARMQGALTSPSSGMLIRSREPRDQGASRDIRATCTGARD